MDKKKVKIILIAIACLLAIFLLYRTLSRISENKTSAAGKIDSANADLTIKKNQDAYVAERETQEQADESNKVEMINEAQKAEGFDALDKYLETLSDSQKEQYKKMRTEYIRVMGVDPGVMSLNDLKRWIADYTLWESYNDRYIELTGTSKSYLDPDFDTADEMKAALLTAESEIKSAWEQAWLDEYELFIHDRNGLKGCPYISLPTLRKWLDSPEQLLPFQEYLTQKYNTFMTQTYPKVSAVWTSLKNYFNEGYINWKNSNHNFVRGALDLPEGTYNDVALLGANSYCLLSLLMKNEGGVSIYSEVNSFNAPKNKMTWYNLLDASLAVANFQMAYQEGTNILGAIATAGISAAIQKNNKVRNYMPERLNNLMASVEFSMSQVYTPFGSTEASLQHTTLPKYAAELYGMSRIKMEKIEDGDLTLEEFLKSSDYQKDITK